MPPSMTGPAPTSRIIPMIGHPIAQVKSLAPINAWLVENGHDACMVPVDVLPGRVPAFFDFVRGWANCAGVSITIPHKQAAFAACDSVTERARIARAVNMIRRGEDGALHGDMTDGLAFVEAVRAKGRALAGIDFLLIGAGGAGSAVAHAVAEAGSRSVCVIEIDIVRREALMATLRERHPGLILNIELEANARIEIAFNATPLGMKPGDPLPFDLARLPAHALIADAVTKPVITPWLEAARARGHSIQTGEEMALAQVLIQPPFWGFGGGS